MSRWDTGLEWRTAIVSRDETFLAIDVPFVTQRILRAFTDNEESYLVEHYIRAATALGERLTGAHIQPKTMTLTIDGFPEEHVEFVDAPIQSIASVAYVDSDGVTQTYGGSPPSWIFQEAGPARKARLTLGYGESWPTPRAQAGSVVITYDVGYATPDDVPYDIRQAIAVTVGEFYKNPDLSNADGLNPNLLGLSHFWPRRWSNGV